jgi:hypothetical protein
MNSIVKAQLKGLLMWDKLRDYYPRTLKPSLCDTRRKRTTRQTKF